VSHLYTGRASPRTGNATPLTVLKLFLVAFVAIAGTSVEATANAKYAGIVVDAKTGKTLYSNDADQLRYPASLTKMMTLYLTFEALDAGKISLDSPVPVSRHAASEPPSKLYLRAGQTITVEQIILGLVTRSANDAATALGEFLGGSEDRFGRIMTNKAHALGMTRTTFRNANGLPEPEQMTTARDMATLGIALREHFPQYYHYFSTRAFHYNGGVIGNHNHLLGRVEGVDGIKTGYTHDSGFNLVTSVVRNGRSVVAVVMGGRTGSSRDKQMKELIAKYMPKASTSGSGDLVAETRLAPTLGVVDLPKHGPRPEFRNPSAVRVALAYADDAMPVDFPMPDSRPVVGRQALIKTLQQQEHAIALPSAPATIETAAIAPAAAAKVDAMTTASTPDAPDGWVIQIGAAPDQASAVRLLEKAKASNKRLLASAEPFTVVYGDGGDRLYRARFGGFKGKDSAWAACASLKKSGYGCWATQQ